MPEQSDPTGPKAPLHQDPHKTGRRENNLELAIGRQVRRHRKTRHLTMQDLSAKTGISAGMLSKIENGATSPSLGTLQTLSHALGVPLVSLLASYREPRGVMHVKAGAAVEVERTGTRAGHQYHLLGHIGANASGIVVEPYLITLSAESDVFPTFQHDGLEVLYVLEGTVDYRHGDQLFRLEPGDSLFFDADAPHGPEGLVTLPVRFLSIISYASDP